ncbi:MAG: PAS domain S-box protein [Bacteroidota bacterium]|nr:PAS domain S-box protein [Bacteroidota bacterium]
MEKVKILAIDDNADNLVVIKALLTVAFPQATFISSLSVKEGIELCLSEIPDVILLDIEMPEMDGCEVCKILKTNGSTKSIPIVMLTSAQTNRESRIKALKLGADAFLVNPVDKSELTAQIRAMLRIKESEDRKVEEKEQLENLVIERTQKLQAELTELKKAEQALLENEEKYSILFMDSPDSYLIISDGIFVDCNRAAEVMLRGDRTQIIGQAPDALSPEFQSDGRKSSESAKEKIAEAFLNGKNTFEWIHRRFDGSDFYVEVSIVAMMLKGKPTLFTTWRDITERRKAGEALKEREQLFRGLFNASPDAILLIDHHHPTVSWPIVDCNEAACQMNGYTCEEMIGQSIDMINVTEGTAEDRISYVNYLRQEGVSHIETFHRHKDGHVFPVEVSTSIVTLGGHEMVLGIDRDITERKEVEEELQKSYDLINKLAAQVPGVVYQYRLYPDGRSAFPYSSPGMYDIYEVTSEEVREDASPVFTRIHPDDFDFIVDTINESARNQTLYHSEFRVILPKQGLRWRLCDAKPERLEDGSTLWYGIITDITERKLAELALRESEDRYSRFISQLSEGVYRFECYEPMDINLPIEEQIDFIYDQMFIAECNKAFQEMYGIDDEKEIIGKSHLDFHGGRDNPLNRNALREFILNGYRIENALTEEKNHLGQIVFFSNNSLGILENNHLVRMWGTQTDITDKTRADQVQHVLYTISNAALSSKNLHELIELISDELGKLLDSTNFFIAFYDEETEMLSTVYERDEMDDINTWPASKSITGYVIRNKKSLLVTENEVRELCEAGEIEMYGTLSKIWLGVPLFAENKIAGALVVQSYDNPEAYTEKDQQMLEFISDQITISIERKKSEQEIKAALAKAQESDRLKSSFLANMSHEIRTPLNAIIGFSELIRDPDFEPEQQDEFAQLINDSGNNLLAILSDIMDISKIEAGQVVIKKHKMSVNQLILSLQKEFSRKTDKKKIELQIDSESLEEEIVIESDETRIRQIIANFLSNAIKFTETGYIELGIKTTENFVQFHVKDTGIGIPKAYHDKIFERFRQVETSHTRKYGGNGLGLSISKSLVELLGGTIGMESEEGKGSTFYFKVPRN